MLHAIRDAVLRAQGRRRPRLRRRRRPLRRRRQRGRGDLRRQDRRDAGARPFGDPQGRAVRRRREVDRPVPTDPVLISSGARTDYWKTGHSYIKRHTAELGALAGFEKSGHFFFNSRSAAAMTTASSRRSRSATCSTAIPAKRWPSLKRRCRRPGPRRPCRRTAPTRSNTASSTQVVKHFETAQAEGEKVAGQAIRDLVTVNGVRVTLEDGTWGLVRASSNKPELVVVVESPVSEHACATCSRRWTACCARIRKSATTIRRSDYFDLDVLVVIAGLRSCSLPALGRPDCRTFKRLCVSRDPDRMSSA